MPVYEYPGVYVEEKPSGVRVIEAASTSTAAFFGVAEKGPVGEVKKIFNFDAFKIIYGGFIGGGYFLAHAVLHFFNNGGAQCYIGRVADEDVETASVTILDRGADESLPPADSMKISAISPGVWGNSLMVGIDSASAEDPVNQFNLSVFQEVPNDPPEELEVFENLSMDPGAENFVETVVNSDSLFIQIKVNDQNPNVMKGYSESGVIAVDPAAPDDLLDGTQRKLQINMHGDGIQEVDLTTELAGADLTQLETIRAAIEEVITGLTPLKGSNSELHFYDQATVTITGDNPGDSNRLRITSGHESPDSTVVVLSAEVPTENAAGPLHLGPDNGGTEVSGSAVAPVIRPQDSPVGGHFLIGDAPIADPVSAATPGDDGTLPLQDTHYEGAFDWLNKIRDVSLIAIPGIGSPGIADAGMNYCRNRPLSDCFFIADMEKSDNDLEDAKDYTVGIKSPNSYGAVYFPWIKATDPKGLSPEPIEVPPSGAIAGLYARIDNRRGVWKAPAGTEATLAGARGLTVNLTDVQQGNLNKPPKSVCVIRDFPASGIVVWGARTLSTDPEHKYVPIRRTAIFLRVSIFNGIQWAVFEPNDHRLWSSLRANIGSFMNGLFRNGAFQGEKASDAYFVRCGLGSTMTQGDIDRGQVIVEVGFAPLKPAEFVIVRIQQMAGQQ